MRGLGQLCPRWDGRGIPEGVKEEELTIAARVVLVAQGALTLLCVRDINSVVEVVRMRRGGAYDPRIADLFCARAPVLLAGLQREPAWETVLALEPGTPQRLLKDQPFHGSIAKAGLPLGFEFAQAA